jgi:hypothetical protein
MKRHARMARKADSKTDVLQGTLDLMVLQTLESMGAQPATRLPRGWNRFRTARCS